MATSINVDDRHDVEAVQAAAPAAGGPVTRPGRPTDWGAHIGYFADAEGHPLETALGPGMPVSADRARPTLTPRRGQASAGGPAGEPSYWCLEEWPWKLANTTQPSGYSKGPWGTFAGPNT